MFCGLETREAILDKAQQWMKFSHPASPNGIASFSWRLPTVPSPSDSAVLWGIAGMAVLSRSAHRDIAVVATVP